MTGSILIPSVHQQLPCRHAGASTVACPADAVAPTPPNVVDNCGRTMTASAPVISADPLCAGTKTYTYTLYRLCR